MYTIVALAMQLLIAALFGPLSTSPAPSSSVLRVRALITAGCVCPAAVVKHFVFVFSVGHVEPHNLKQTVQAIHDRKELMRCVASGCREQSVPNSLAPNLIL